MRLGNDKIEHVFIKGIIKLSTFNQTLISGYGGSLKRMIIRGNDWFKKNKSRRRWLDL